MQVTDDTVPTLVFSLGLQKKIDEVVLRRMNACGKSSNLAYFYTWVNLVNCCVKCMLDCLF